MNIPRSVSRTARVAVPLAIVSALLAGTVVSPAASAAAGCSVSYTVTNQWSGGFGADVRITNLGDAVTSWRLTWSWPAGQSVTQMWNATYSGSGANAVATNVGYNGAIATNGSSSFGFNGSWSGSNPVPTSFSLNGTRCSGAVTNPPTSTPTTTRPPTTPPTTPPPTTPSGTTREISIPNNLGSHDPSRIVNDNGSYYLYSTSGDLSGWNTTDGKNWKRTPGVFQNGLPASILNLVPVNNGVWAPDIIWSPTMRVFLMYYSVANWDDPKKSATGLVTSPTLNPNASNYRWTDRGVVISRSDATGSTIDPAPFFDSKGDLWLAYGSGYSTVNRSKGINIIALDKNTGLRSDNTVHTQLSCGCEAAYVHYRSGYYYLFWNTGGCCSGASSSYTIHVARSTNVTGPYTERSSKFYSSTGSIHGPGHIGILSENGKDRYSYHYYPDSGGSVVGLGTITWGSDGWPQK